MIRSLETRWSILFILFFARLSTGFQFQSLGSVGPDLVENAGLKNFELGTLIGIFMLPGVVLAFPAGYLGKYFHDKSIITFGLICLCIGGVLSVIFKDFYSIAVGRIICGIGFVLTTIYLSKITIDWFDGRELATAMSILIISWPGGIALSQLIHPQIALKFGWIWAISSANSLCFLAALVIYFFYRPTAVEKSNVAATQKENHLSRHEWYKTGLAALSWAFYNSGYLVFLSFAYLTLITNGFSNFLAAGILSCSSFLIMLSIPLGGLLADKFKANNGIVFLSSLTAILTLILLPYGNFVLFLCILFGAIGMSAGGIIISLAGLAMRTERRAYGMGVYQTIYFLFAAVSPVIAGWLYDYTQNSKSVLSFAASLFLLSWVFYFSFTRFTTSKC